MSLYGMMRTGVSGMNAQSSKLSAVSDNIANSDTTGYKEADTQFSTLVLPGTGSGYSSGSVDAKTRYNVTETGRPAGHDLEDRPCDQGRRLLHSRQQRGTGIPHPRRLLRPRRQRQSRQRIRLHAARLRLYVRHAFGDGKRLCRSRSRQRPSERRLRDAVDIRRVHEQPALRRDRRSGCGPAFRQWRHAPSTRPRPRSSPMTISATRSSSTSISRRRPTTSGRSPPSTRTLPEAAPDFPIPPARSQPPRSISTARPAS